MIPENIMYLNDSAMEIEGVRFWGSPITPWFYNWAFNRQRGMEINAHWTKIPEDTQVLITHGPPWGVLDRTEDGSHVGCEDLSRQVQRIQPKLHVFGHIHESNGRVEHEGTTYVNASVLNARYQNVFAPQVWDLR